MSDDIKGFAVTLDKDITEEHAARLVSAISFLNGVVAVEPIKGDIGDMITRARAKNELMTRLYKAVETF